MAFNIDLSNKFKANTVQSTVDSRIILDKEKNKNEIFSDVKLDLKFEEVTELALNAKINNKDLNKIVDEESVINAFRNILNTTLYSRLLNPDMQFDLRKYLFEPISAPIAYLIGYEIFTTLGKYDDRIKIDKVKICPSVVNNCYGIILSISIPQLNKSISLKSILNQDGYFTSN